PEPASASSRSAIGRQAGRRAAATPPSRTHSRKASSLTPTSPALTVADHTEPARDALNSRRMELGDRVRAALIRAGVSGEDRMLVACPSGPDSLALADCMADIRPVTLCYVDHGLRPEAALEAEAVRAFARRRGLAAEVLRAPVDRRDGRGLEDA